MSRSRRRAALRRRGGGRQAAHGRLNGSGVVALGNGGIVETASRREKRRARSAIGRSMACQHQARCLAARHFSEK